MGFLRAIFYVASLGIALSFSIVRADAADHVPSSNEMRVVRSLDRDWTFQYFPQQTPDKRWSEANAADSKCSAVALPHTWSTYETTADLHPFIGHATECEDSYR